MSSSMNGPAPPPPPCLTEALGEHQDAVPCGCNDWRAQHGTAQNRRPPSLRHSRRTSHALPPAGETPIERISWFRQQAHSGWLIRKEAPRTLVSARGSAQQTLSAAITSHADEGGWRRKRCKADRPPTPQSIEPEARADAFGAVQFRSACVPKSLRS